MQNIVLTLKTLALVFASALCLSVPSPAREGSVSSQLKRITLDSVQYSHMGQMIIDRRGNCYASFLQNYGEGNERLRSESSEVTLACFPLTRALAEDFSPERDVVFHRIGGLGDTFLGFKAASIFKDNSMCKEGNIIHLTFQFLPTDDDIAHLFKTDYNIRKGTFSGQEECLISYNGSLEPFTIKAVSRIIESEGGTAPQIKDNILELVSQWSRHSGWWYATLACAGKTGSNGLVVRTKDFKVMEYVAMPPFNCDGMAEISSIIKDGKLFVACRQNYGIYKLLLSYYDLKTGTWGPVSEITDGNSRPWFFICRKHLYLMNTPDKPRKYINISEIGLDGDTRPGATISARKVATLQDCGYYYATATYRNAVYMVVTKDTESFGRLGMCGKRGLETTQTPLSICEDEFLNPPMSYRPIPLWFWNDTKVDTEGVASQLRQMIEKDGYGGCAILPFGPNFQPDYLGEEYMRIYTRAVELAESLGARISLYDEYGFPSGSMGFSNADGVPRFKIAHPDKTIKRLDKKEIAVESGETVEVNLSESPGKFMAVAAYDLDSQHSESLREFIVDGKLVWTAPKEGNWKVMVFDCVEDGKPRMDYLDSEAAELFVQDTHEKYWSSFGDKFASVVTSTFFDEPTMYYAQGRMWTERFNDEFMSRYGMYPDAFYPALWYDVGAQTAAVRNMMFGLHTNLYVEGFTKTIADWAESHGIISTGHQDQEEVANTTGVSGDLMLHGKYMSMPGIDKIGGDRPAELFYKVVSSSANNWDKPWVMSETFGAMGNIPIEEMYRIAIEQYTKGITDLIPHAVWYDDSNVTFLPELSWRNPLYNESIPPFNTFISRMRYLLARPGRHVADIAMLYPIQTQYAGHYLDGKLGPVKGGVEINGTDYPEVSRILCDELGMDFTYIHPEVLDGRCIASKGKLRMDNKMNKEEFSVLILPGVKTISLGNMKQVMKAWRQGVKIVFTTQLPCQSADLGVDNGTIVKMVDKMISCSRGRRSAVFVETPDPSSLAAVLAGVDGDVDFLSEGQPFNYIHKVVHTEGGDTGVFLFGNIDMDERCQRISLRGEYDDVQIFDPHTGSITSAPSDKSGGRTFITMTLAPSESKAILVQLPD